MSDNILVVILEQFPQMLRLAIYTTKGTRDILGVP